MSEKFRICVKKVEFPTDGKGFIRPCIRLTKTFTFDYVDGEGKKFKAVFDALALNDVSTVFNDRVTKGTKADVVVDDVGNVNIERFLSSTDNGKIAMPFLCSACGAKLRAFQEKHLVCDNVFCHAINTAGIYHLLFNVTKNYKLIDKYINNFPIKEININKDKNETIKATNLLEYLHFFYSVGSKNTVPRENMFKNAKVFDDKEQYDLIQIEIKLAEILSSRQSNEFYWKCINIPNLTIKELSKFKPETLTKKHIESFNTVKKRTTLQNGRQYFKVLLRQFKKLEK